MATSADTLGKMLGQSRPGDTNAASIYSPPNANIIAEITRIVVCETSGSGRSFRIFLDADGTTYDQTTALYYDVAISANTTTTIEASANSALWMTDANGNLAVRSSFASALTFTVFGVEHERTFQR